MTFCISRFFGNPYGYSKLAREVMHEPYELFNIESIMWCSGFVGAFDQHVVLVSRQRFQQWASHHGFRLPLSYAFAYDDNSNWNPLIMITCCIPSVVFCRKPPYCMQSLHIMKVLQISFIVSNGQTADLRLTLCHQTSSLASGITVARWYNKDIQV